MKRTFTFDKAGRMCCFEPKLLTLFRIVGILVLVICLQLNATAFSQKLSISVNNASLEEVFKQIKAQSDFMFLYDNELIRKSTPVSLTLRNASLKEVLDKSFKNQPFTYSLIEKNIVVKPIPDASQATNLSVSARAEIRGTVLDQNGDALIGATVKVKGTTAGVSTDVNGNFTINAETNSTLVISYTGYETLEVPVNSRSTISIRLNQDTRLLNEVVITALGIAKERKALGYSVTEIKGEDLTQAREINIGNSLVGKVAGLNVNSVSGGPGSAVNIQIRGMSSISQSNQPLYVVNGVPMTNETSSGRGQFQDVADRGDNLGNINPDDIESISVLKGAAASALYGSRAKAGVILITTKSGKVGAPGSLEYNSNYVINQVVDQTDYQYEYGQGSMSLVAGVLAQNKPLSATEAQNTSGSSWGPKMDGQPYVQMDGVTRPYSPARNNVTNFYQLGQTLTNTLSFSKGFDGGSVRFSVSDLANKNIVETSKMGRQTFNLSGNMTIVKRLTLDVRNNFILEKAINRTKLGDSPGNVNASINRLATSINIDDFQAATNPDGSELTLGGGTFTTNPWFAARYFRQNTDRERLLSSATLRYNFDNGLFIQARGARDGYTDRFTRLVPNGTAYRPTGELSEQITKFKELNADVLAGMPLKVNSNITVTPSIGGSFRNIQSEGFTTSGTGFAVPYVYYIGNVPTRTTSYNLGGQQEVHAAYGILEVNYKDLLYLTGTGRSDWYSTLATPDNSNPVDQFYPSISGSFVFTELLKNSKWLNFGKIRAGYAQVGQATGPNQTQLTYGFSSTTLDGLPVGNVSGSSVPNKELKPSLASEFEVGTEMTILNNRVTLDLTYYNKKSTNEIVNAPASSTSGYTAAALNIGRIQNIGFEGLISVTPIKRQNGLTWITALNGTINNNKILALAPGDAPLTWATARSGTAYVQYRVGEPAAQLVAFEYQRDASGAIALSPTTGLPLASTLLTSQGSAYDKWMAGWTNDFSYKRFNASFLIDGKFGGKIFSATESASYSNGKNKATLEGREKIYGINRTAQQYYANMTNISALFVKDASFIKFREVAFGYVFPPSLFNNKVKSLSLSIVGRNLFTLMKKTDNIDPESAYSGEATGLEAGLLPPQRTFGLNLGARF